MGRLRGVVLVGCLLLAACDGGGGGTAWESRDYIDFVRFGGVTYYVADHGVGRPIVPGDLGPEFARVRANPPASGSPLAYRPRDGDAAFVAVGSPVFSVKGYRPGFRVAASHHGRLWLYEAEEAAGARTGADLLDLDGKVRYLSVNSGRYELARIRTAPGSPSWSARSWPRPSGPRAAGSSSATASSSSTWPTGRRSGASLSRARACSGRASSSHQPSPGRSRTPWRRRGGAAAGRPNRSPSRWCRPRRTGCPRGPQGR